MGLCDTMIVRVQLLNGLPDGRCGHRFDAPGIDLHRQEPNSTSGSTRSGRLVGQAGERKP